VSVGILLDRMRHTPLPLREHEIRAVSVAAGVDPRTIRRRLLGARTMPLTRERIDRALRQLGHHDVLELLEAAS
jgi:hypothetical protein